MSKGRKENRKKNTKIVCTVFSSVDHSDATMESDLIFASLALISSNVLELSVFTSI